MAANKHFKELFVYKERIKKTITIRVNTTLIEKRKNEKKHEFIIKAADHDRGANSGFVFWDHVGGSVC